MTTGVVPKTSGLYPFFNGDGCLGTKGFIFSFPSATAAAPLETSRWVFCGGAAALAKTWLTRFPTRETSTFSLRVVVFLAKITSLPTYPVASGRASWIGCRPGETNVDVDDESWEGCRASRCKVTVSDFSPSSLMLVTYNKFSNNNQRWYNDTDHGFRISLCGVAGRTTTREGEPSQSRVDTVRDAYSSQHNQYWHENRR